MEKAVTAVVGWPINFCGQNDNFDNLGFLLIVMLGKIFNKIFSILNDPETLFL